MQNVLCKVKKQHIIVGIFLFGAAQALLTAGFEAVFANEPTTYSAPASIQRAR